MAETIRQRLKVVINLTHPTMSLEEIGRYEKETLVELGRGRVAAQMARDFLGVEIEVKSNGAYLTGVGAIQIFPKVSFEAQSKTQVEDVDAALDAVLVDWVAAVTARLNADGFTITKTHAHL